MFHFRTFSDLKLISESLYLDLILWGT